MTNPGEANPSVMDSAFGRPFGGCSALGPVVAVPLPVLTVIGVATARAGCPLPGLPSAGRAIMGGVPPTALVAISGAAR